MYHVAEGDERVVASTWNHKENKAVLATEALWRKRRIFDAAEIEMFGEHIVAMELYTSC